MSTSPLDPKTRFSDLLVLLSLKGLPAHGYQIETNIINITFGQFHFAKGAIYRTLGRLLQEGHVTVLEENYGHHRRIYDLTSAGEHRLHSEIYLLRRMVSTYDHR